FGLVPEELDDAIVTNEFPVFEINASECHPHLLGALLGSKQFYGQIESKVSGATGRRRMEPEELLEMEVPLEAPNQQALTTEAISRANSITLGLQLAASAW